MKLLNGLFPFNIELLPYLILSLIVAFTVHEFSHAYIANRLGDPTAKNQGRLTLNPMVHLDVLGTLMIFLAGFGWAKPVPVNYFHFKNKRLAGILVSFAGPLSNLLVSIFAMFLWFLLIKLGFLSDTTNIEISKLFTVLIQLNITLFIFNLLPIPPLDGYRIIEALVPNDMKPRLIQYEQYGTFIFLFLIITPIGDYIFDPLFNTVQPFIFESIINIGVRLLGF